MIGAALILAIAAAVFGIGYYRYRFVRSPADLLALLPPGDKTSFFANVELLRRAGFLKLLGGSKMQRDSDYESFVRETGFDYTVDLDVMAGGAQGDQLFFLLQGRFHWDRLRQYAAAHGGACGGDFCKFPATSKAGRNVSFLPIQPNVLALAIGPKEDGAKALRPSSRKLNVPLPAEPVWVSLSETLLRNPVDLPLPLRIFVISLQSAHPVLLSIDAAAEGTGSALKLQLDAGCESESAAETIRSQLEIQTKMLRLELARERQQPNPADLTGLLTAGSFQVVNRHLTGVWPVRSELLRTLQ